MKWKKKKQSAKPEVASIRNDYVRSVEQQDKLHQAHKVRLFRRLSVFGVIVLLASIWLGSTIYAQTQTIAEKEQQREDALATLQQVENEQAMLQEQIILLNDEEYLAKLARKEYFLSEEGEIIFTVPKVEENEEEKE
ncbi:MAG TPA: septum formation initiator family protein [Planococcus sp. (in: firmicutes)]|nr:septum formation initiator family protein [Planococcus sp. (in: firmicutes)]